MPKNYLAKAMTDSYNKGYDDGYNQGHIDGTSKILDVSSMAFCVALNKSLGIGVERFASVLKEYDKIINKDVMDDFELAEIRLEKEFKALTGQSIHDVIKHV